MAHALPKTASNDPDWVVVSWAGNKPAEQGRRPSWAAADALRDEMRANGESSRITIEASEAWDNRKDGSRDSS